MSATFRAARPGDLAALVAMLADDPLGQGRETVSDPPDGAYVGAFAAIAADANCELVVAERDGALVGCLQITYIRGLSRRGATRALIEGVRVAAPARGEGIGGALMGEALRRARARGAVMAQLATDKSRADAHRFYARRGFVNSHEGFKLDLTAP